MSKSGIYFSKRVPCEQTNTLFDLAVCVVNREFGIGGCPVNEKNRRMKSSFYKPKISLVCMLGFLRICVVRQYTDMPQYAHLFDKRGWL